MPSDSVPPTWEPDRLLALALSRPSEALAAAREVLARHPPAAQAAVAHQAAGVVFREFGDIGKAIVEFKDARRFARQAGDLDREADVSASLAAALVLAGQSRRGLSILDALLERMHGVPAGRILIRRTGVFYILGRNAEALRDAQAAVDLLTGAGDLVREARALHWRAAVYLAMGNIQRADQDYARAEALWVECAQQLEYADTRYERGLAAHTRGDLPTALAHLDHAQMLLDQLGVFAAEFFVSKCTVLLAAGLVYEALLEANAAVARIEREHGSATRRAELVYSAALAAAATGDFGLAQERSYEALRLFRRQQRPWWAARAELALLLCRFGDDRYQAAALLPAARRVTARLDTMDYARAVDAHLLTGRIALAAGRRDEAARHLRTAANARHRGSCAPAASAGWPRHSGRGRTALAGHAGRLRARARPCSTCTCSTLGATELRTPGHRNGAQLADMALRHAVRRGDARLFLRVERTLARHGAPGHPGPGRRPTATWWPTWPPCATWRPGWTAAGTAGPRRPRWSGSAVRLETAVRQRVLHTAGR